MLALARRGPHEPLGLRKELLRAILALARRGAREPLGPRKEQLRALLALARRGTGEAIRPPPWKKLFHAIFALALRCLKGPPWFM